MRILILDDEQYRHDGFAKIFRNHELWHVYTLKQFMHATSERSYDIICFDHDIGENETGLDAARFLVERVDSQRWPEKCLVHSWNVRGAMNIAETLQRAGMQVKVKPFAVSTGK